MQDYAQQTLNYYRVWFDDTDPKALIAEVQDMKGFRKYAIFEGKVITDWPALEFTLEGERATDYLFCTLSGWILVSEKVRSTLEGCGIHGIQYLPIKFANNPLATLLQPYYVMNVLNTVEALDWEKTRWMHPEVTHTDPYPILNIITEVLQRNLIQNLNVFLLSVKGQTKIEPYVSDNVKDCLERAKADSGFKFIPIRIS